jgi:hypothetical protein
VLETQLYLELRVYILLLPISLYGAVLNPHPAITVQFVPVSKYEYAEELEEREYYHTHNNTPAVNRNLLIKQV